MDNKAVKTDPIELVVGALRAIGDLTAAAIAEKTGMAYSTVTPKLRTLEETGRAERVRTNGRTFWRAVTAPAQESAAEAGSLTEAGPVTEAESGTDSGDTTAVPASETDPTTASEPSAAAEPLLTAPDPGTADHGHTAGPDATPTTDAAQLADDAADSADTAPTDTPDPNSAPTAEPEPATVTPGEHTSGDGAPDPQPATDTAAPATPASEKTRRPPGALDRTTQHIMQGNPDRPYKVTELARLIDQADAADGHNYPKASPGAVVLACDRLVDRGDATRVSERPATYQLAATRPVNP